MFYLIVGHKKKKEIVVKLSLSVFILFFVCQFWVALQLNGFLYKSHFFIKFFIKCYMNFLEDINNYITKEYGLGVSDYRYVNISGKYVYVEGHSGINELSDKEISFNIKKKLIRINGSDLIVKYFDNSTAIVQGQIVNVVVL